MSLVETKDKSASIKSPSLDIVQAGALGQDFRGHGHWSGFIRISFLSLCSS